MTPSDPSLRGVANLETVAPHQTARTNAPSPEVPKLHGRCSHRYHGSLHPAQAALLRREAALQDEHSDKLQDRFEAAEQGQPIACASAVWHLCLINMKAVVLGSRPPKPTNPLHRQRATQIGARLHLRLLRILGTLLQSCMPTGRISEKTWVGGFHRNDSYQARVGFGLT